MLETEIIADVFKIACELEPDYKNWTYQPHSWCIDTAYAVEDYLFEKGIAYRDSRPNKEQPMNLFADQDFLHAWVELEDGTILDPTIKQFFLPNTAICGCPEFSGCSSCKPYLNKEEFHYHTLWVVEPDDLYHRHLYVYANEKKEALCSAIESFGHPLS